MSNFHAGEVQNGKLRIGDTEMAVFNPENMMMVPDTLFYENAQVLIVEVKITVCSYFVILLFCIYII